MKRSHKILFSILLAAIVCRLALPFVLRHNVNRFLQQRMENYSGHIEDFSISLLHGSYTLHGLRVWKKDRTEFDPLFTAEKMEVSILSHLLLEKKVMGSLTLTRPRLSLLDSVMPANQQFVEGQEWQDFVGKMMPIPIETLKVQQGILVFENRDYKKQVQIVCDDISLSMINIHNTEKVRKGYPGRLNFSARVQREAWLRGLVQFDYYAERPSLFSKVDLSGLKLDRLNYISILYGLYYFRSGEMNLHSQVYVNNGEVRGYLTPFFKNIDVIPIPWNNRVSKNILQDAVASVGNLLLKNSNKNAQGRRYSFSGQMNPQENS
ncbi:MAG TPA: DUF748 domain-containing protein, partial [Bdellovibrio sp.]|nr:DUF748 domain-containing protein [Bdellovibrio sp.]